jgi:hypothetical protein
MFVNNILRWLDNNEEIKSKVLIKITIYLIIFVLTVFLVSCETSEDYGNRVGYSPPPTNKNIMDSQRKKYTSKLKDNNKGQEQLYIKRKKIHIQEKEVGSTSGSIWADSALPKSLLTEFKPTRAGEYITVNIPEYLRSKSDSASPANAAPGAKKTDSGSDALRSFKFEVLGTEPGGDVFIRGVKNINSDSGEQKTVVVLAKIPRREVNNSEINAQDLSEVSVSESSNGVSSNYATTGWDTVVSQKLSEKNFDMKAMASNVEADKKEVEAQKKTLADQKKSLDEEADRLKKDRNRLNTESARAKALLDAASAISTPAPAAAPGAPAAPGTPPATPGAQPGAAQP